VAQWPGGPVVILEPPDLFAAAAEWIASAMRRALEGGSCSIALSGGNSPRPVYALLAKPPLRDTIDWARVAVFFADERAVAPDAEESNYRMAKDALLDHVPVPPEHIHRMEAEKADRDGAARAYERMLPASLDVLILGIGPDGHTASLFPGARTLGERLRRVVMIDDSPKPPPVRMTITPPVISAARSIVMIVTGADKADAVKRAIEGSEDPGATPGQMARRGQWFLDGAAASRLTANG
jgi:6-phosphogluconolactonase